MDDFPKLFHKRPLAVRQFSRISYDEALPLQQSLVEKRQQQEIPDTLLLLEHDPVISLGKRSESSDILVPKKALREKRIVISKSDRGGQTTFHGPGQLVGYLIADLRPLHRRLRRFIELIEKTLIETVADFGISAHHHDNHRGVWTKEGKIAAIGISIHRGVSMHGFALNVSVDLSCFRLITPCGLRSEAVVSMESLRGEQVAMETVKNRYLSQIYAVLGFSATG